MMLGTKPIAKLIPTPYATRADFCRIFNEEMHSLFMLGFLLTADRETAERCFVRGLKDSVEGNPVFKEWALSWARRTIVQNAIREIAPHPGESSSSSSSASDHHAQRLGIRQIEMAAILELSPFDRFAFVMSVLEHYSDQECSVLLGCTRRDLITARTHALQQIAESAEYHRGQLALTETEEPGPREGFRSVAALGGTLPSVVPA
jgi:DNA-directed RNA polymerase specialized sigma24 family protein